jgi:preprotein translocase subunit SecE
MTKSSARPPKADANAAATDKKPAAPEKRGAARPPLRAGRAASVAQSGGRVPRFLREVRIEMSKVTWPTRPELLQSTWVVLVAIVIAAIYIGIWDVIWSQIVSLARLGS